MASFGEGNVFDNMPMGNPGINMGTTGSMHDLMFGTEAWGETDQRHWRERYPSRPYAQPDRSYDHYEPAYRYGTAAARHHRDRQWDEVESDLERGWDRARGSSSSTWGDMKHAVRDAWDHVRSPR